MILFRGFDKVPDRGVGWADIFTYSYACYLFGIEKGYSPKDINIVFPRYNYPNNFDNYEHQDTSFLPWKYIKRNSDIDYNLFEEVIDTTQKDSLFKYFPGFPAPGTSGLNMDIAIDVYYKITGKQPYLNLPRDTLRTKYILMQYRNNPLGSKAKERITDVSELTRLLEILKENTENKYEFWKIGENSPVDNEFDKVIPLMYDDLDGFMRLLRNSSMLVGSHTGPPLMAYYFKDVPVIRFGMMPKIDAMDKTTRLKKEIPHDILEAYNITHHPLWRDNDFLYRRKNMVPDNIGLMYLDKGKSIPESDIIKMLNDNGL